MAAELGSTRRLREGRGRRRRRSRTEVRQTGDALLEVENVTKHFPITKGIVFKHEVASVKALDGVSLTVNRGETIGIVGESGCGKSTLARVVMRLLEPTSGTVRFDGRDVTSVAQTSCSRTRRELMMIFQDPYASLNPRKRVGFIVAEPLEMHGIGTDAERKRRVQDLLEVVGLNPEHYNRFPHEFSGGQRQRIGIARALAVNPKLIVADEPVSALDVSVQAQILNLLKDLQSEFGLTYVFIAHDLSVVRHISDRVAVMYLGKLVELASSSGPVRGAATSRTPARSCRRCRSRTRGSAAARGVRAQGDVPNPINPPNGCRFHPRCPRAVGHVRAQRPAARRGARGRARGGVLLPAREVAAHRGRASRRRADPSRSRRGGRRRRSGPGRRARERMIARGVRDLSLGLLGVCGLTAVGSLVVGLMAGLPAQRAVAGGLMLVGSLVFTAGAFVGLRDPARSRDGGRPRRLLEALGPGRRRSTCRPCSSGSGSASSCSVWPSTRERRADGAGPIAAPKAACDDARARPRSSSTACSTRSGSRCSRRHLAPARTVPAFVGAMRSTTRQLRTAPSSSG